MWRPRNIPRALLAAAVVCLLGTTAAQATLVIFTYGGFMHVNGFKVEGERIRLELQSGGVVVIPMKSIERILDEEPAATAAQPAPAPTIQGFSLYFGDSNSTPEVPYGEMIWHAARRHGLNPKLVAAVVEAESAFNPEAVSVKGAQGLMQLMPATAARFGLGGRDVFDPEKNLDAGSRYLAWLIERFGGRLDQVLSAYNAGEGSVAQHGGPPPYRETQDYVRRIYKALGLEPGTTTTGR